VGKHRQNAVHVLIVGACVDDVMIKIQIGSRERKSVVEACMERKSSIIHAATGVDQQVSNGGNKYCKRTEAVDLAPHVLGVNDLHGI
jgi:hypothetical protein